MISRTPFLTAIPVAGQYRYGNLLQIIPPQLDDPRPPTIHGWYGATLAVAFDERAAPERTEDVWAHDHRERARLEFLTSRVNSEIGSVNWLDAATRIQADFFRRRAVEHEALRLLQALTNNAFRRTDISEHSWYIDPLTKKPIYGQQWYPSFVSDQWGAFWTGQADGIPMVDPHKHFGRVGIGPEDTVFTLPSDIETHLRNYFALAPQRKITFSRVCELFGNAQEIWSTSRSLSLAAYVFAIDALCHADDPRPQTCPDCGNLTSNQTCSACGGPRFGLTKRFQKFVETYVRDDDESKIVSKLFRVRSDIVHRGELLRADEFDAGFNVGASDDQSYLERGVGRTVRKVLIGWLSGPGSDGERLTIDDNATRIN